MSLLPSLGRSVRGTFGLVESLNHAESAGRVDHGIPDLLPGFRPKTFVRYAFAQGTAVTVITPGIRLLGRELNRARGGDEGQNGEERAASSQSQRLRAIFLVEAPKNWRFDQQEWLHGMISALFVERFVGSLDS